MGWAGMTWILSVSPIVCPFLLENPAPVPGGDDSAGRKAAIESCSRRLAGAADVPGDVVDADAAAARRPVRRRREVGERREGPRRLLGGEMGWISQS